MARTFNCGIGMVVCVGVEHVAEVVRALEGAGEKVYVLGALEAAPAGGQGPAQAPPRTRTCMSPHLSQSP